MASVTRGPSSPGADAIPRYNPPECERDIYVRGRGGRERGSERALEEG